MPPPYGTPAPWNKSRAYGSPAHWYTACHCHHSNKKLKITEHFEKKVNYCILNDKGRQIFIEAFEKRLDMVFLHKKLKRKMTYKTAIKMDCYKLIKYILEDKDFEFFSLKEGC